MCTCVHEVSDLGVSYFLLFFENFRKKIALKYVLVYHCLAAADADSNICL